MILFNFNLIDLYITLYNHTAYHEYSNRHVSHQNRLNLLQLLGLSGFVNYSDNLDLRNSYFSSLIASLACSSVAITSV